MAEKWGKKGKLVSRNATQSRNESYCSSTRWLKGSGRSDFSKFLKNSRDLAQEISEGSPENKGALRKKSLNPDDSLVPNAAKNYQSSFLPFHLVISYLLLWSWVIVALLYTLWEVYSSILVLEGSNFKQPYFYEHQTMLIWEFSQFSFEMNFVSL